MRVALVRQRYTPFGGAERFIERALPALERAGAELTLIARRAEGWGARRFLRVDPFFLGNAWRDWSFARAARRAWRAGGFDLVQSHERIAGCSVYRAGDGVHAQWLEIRRGFASGLERLGMRLNPYHAYVCAAERRMFADPALRAVICNSSMVREEIRRRFGVPAEKLHVIYNGVDLAYFHAGHGDGLRAATRAGLGLAEADRAFLFVGSGFARKGLDAAIAALQACPDRSIVLLVAGKDRHAGRFLAQARHAGVADRVRLLGAQADVRPFYAAADVFLLPTRYDPFPNTALEALAMGLPALVGQCSGAAEIIEAGTNGWVCDPADSAGLARLMQRASAEVGNASRRAGLRLAARRTAERFGLEAMARQLTTLYGTLGTR